MDKWAQMETFALGVWLILAAMSHQQMVMCEADRVWSPSSPRFSCLTHLVRMNILVYVFAGSEDPTIPIAVVVVLLSAAITVAIVIIIILAKR